jgi:hypothetical protein
MEVNDKSNDHKDTAQAEACTPNEGNNHGPATAPDHATRHWTSMNGGRSPPYVGDTWKT